MPYEFKKGESLFVFQLKNSEFKLDEIIDFRTEVYYKFKNTVNPLLTIGFIYDKKIKTFKYVKIKESLGSSSVKVTVFKDIKVEFQKEFNKDLPEVNCPKNEVWIWNDDGSRGWCEILERG